jgi:hypothetical protein
MKSKLLFSLVALLALGGCTSSSSDTSIGPSQETIEAAKLMPVVFEDPSGTPILPGSSAKTLEEGHRVRVRETLEVDELIVNVSFSFTGDWLRIEEPDKLTKYRPNFAFHESWESVLTVTFTIGNFSGTDTYDFVIGEGKSVLYTIKEFQEGVNLYDPQHPENGGIKPGTGEAGDLVSLRGYLTAIYADKNTGIIQDGEYAAQLYRLDLNVVFTGNIGDLIFVTGHATPYNGALQIGFITEVEIQPGSSFPSIIPPTVKEITEADFLAIPIPPTVVNDPENPGYQNYIDNKAGDKAQHTMVTTTVKYVSGNFTVDAFGRPALGVHVTVTVKLGNTNFALYLNYHNGTTTMGAWQEALKDITVGTELTVIGTISWSPTPYKTQILPWAADGLVKI